VVSALGRGWGAEAVLPHLVASQETYVHMLPSRAERPRTGPIGKVDSSPSPVRSEQLGGDLRVR
jgi:hypothetical protein